MSNLAEELIKEMENERRRLYLEKYAPKDLIKEKNKDLRPFVEH